MKKSFFAILISLLFMLSGFCSLTVFADDTIYSEGTLYYMEENDSVTITGCFGKDESVEVPAFIAGMPVNTIAAGAFVGNDFIESVTLPETVTNIEEGAFSSAIRVTQLQAGNGEEDSGDSGGSTESGGSASEADSHSRNSASGSSYIVIQQGSSLGSNGSPEIIASEDSMSDSLDEAEIDLSEDEFLSVTPDSKAAVTDTDEHTDSFHDENKPKTIRLSVIPFMIAGVAVVVVSAIALILMKKSAGKFNH